MSQGWLIQSVCVGNEFSGIALEWNFPFDAHFFVKILASAKRKSDDVISADKNMFLRKKGVHNVREKLSFKCNTLNVEQCDTRWLRQFSYFYWFFEKGNSCVDLKSNKFL